MIKKDYEEGQSDLKEDVKLLLADAIEYDEYTVTLGTAIKWFLTGGIVIAVVMYIFYERWYVSLFVGLIGGIAFIPMRRKQVIEKRKNTLTLQFKEMLQSVKSSLGSESVHDAFIKAKEDLAVQFPEEAYIMQELNLIIQGTILKARLEDLLEDFARRSGVEDIQNFATIFKTCYRRGGNMQEIVGKSITIINEKIEVCMDIETMVAGQKNEQNILLVLPIVFVVMLKAMGGMVDLESAAGIISMTIAIAIFLSAYAISRKIMKIEV
ncbi:hypothetical protein LJC58_04940 [Lachnospiraceae bacterium OttesenSCG-928-D06]|nr:hypothetical protein [Lachnospiraceae bacterium OttesenSCG-928-D06]